MKVIDIMREADDLITLKQDLKTLSVNPTLSDRETEMLESAINVVNRYRNTILMKNVEE